MKSFELKINSKINIFKLIFDTEINGFTEFETIEGKKIILKFVQDIEGKIKPLEINHSNNHVESWHKEGEIVVITKEGKFYSMHYTETGDKNDLQLDMTNGIFYQKNNL